MVAFHVFEIVQIVPNRATHHNWIGVSESSCCPDLVTTVLVNMELHFFLKVWNTRNFKMTVSSVPFRSSHWRCSIKKVVLKNFTYFTGGHLLNESPTQVFSSEICEIFKKTDFEEHLRTTASVSLNLTVSLMSIHN